MIVVGCAQPPPPRPSYQYPPPPTLPPTRRHFALTGWGLAWLMGICAVTCAAACGLVQVGKLKVYHLVLRNRRPHYAPGTLATTLGPLPLQSGGFMLTGVPLVMGEHPGPRGAKAEVSLAKIERALYCLRPAYVLVLLIILAYVVSALDYVYEAMPPCPMRLRRTQRAPDRVLTKVLWVPRNVPRALLWMPVAGGGFGFPHLYSRMRLRHVQGFLRAMDSRSILVRKNVRALRHPDHWKGLDGPDQERLLHTMAETHLEVHVLPAAAAQPAAVDMWVYRPYESGGVHLAADGAMEVTPEGDTLGWGALVADTTRVLATAASGVLTRAASPWAAEWAGKLEAWRLAETLGVAPAAVQCVGADCTSVTLGSNGGVPSQSAGWTRSGSPSPRPSGAAGPTCTCQRSTTPSGQASCPTSRHAPTTWRRWAWAWRVRARTRSQVH